MRSLILTAHVLLILGAGQHLALGETVDRSTKQRQVQVKAQADEDDRRCAYLGYWGSFHLTGPIGTAAYKLGRERYLADLTFDREDNAHWFFRAGNGSDQSTAQWAFSRQPDRCGRYWVWRSDKNGWHRYESTRAWGNRLGGSAQAQQVRTEPSVSRRLVDLETTVNRHTDQINSLLSPQQNSPQRVP